MPKKRNWFTDSNLGHLWPTDSYIVSYNLDKLDRIP